MMKHYQIATFQNAYFLNNCIYLFSFGCAGSLLLCRLLSSCGKQGLLSSCDAWGSHSLLLQSMGPRAHKLQYLQHVGSRVQAQ